MCVQEKSSTAVPTMPCSWSARTAAMGIQTGVAHTGTCPDPLTVTPDCVCGVDVLVICWSAVTLPAQARWRGGKPMAMPFCTGVCNVRCVYTCEGGQMVLQACGWCRAVRGSSPRFCRLRGDGKSSSSPCERTVAIWIAALWAVGNSPMLCCLPVRLLTTMAWNGFFLLCIL